MCLSRVSPSWHCLFQSGCQRGGAAADSEPDAPRGLRAMCIHGTTFGGRGRLHYATLLYKLLPAKDGAGPS